MTGKDLAKVGVTFNSEPHTYTRNADGKRLQGVTRMIQQLLFPDEFACVDEEVLDAKAKYGTQRHHEIQDMIVFGDEPQTEDQKRFSEITEWIKPIASEYTVTDGENFASNIDVVAVESTEENADNIVLIDIKTCATLNRQKVSWQLSLYAKFFEFNNPTLKVSKLYAAWLPKTGREKLVEIPRKSDEDLCKLMHCWLNNEPYTFESKLNQNLIARISEVKYSLTQLEEEYRLLSTQLMQEMTDKGETSYKDDFMSVSLRAATTSRKFDSKAFMQDNPELYNKYTREAAMPSTLALRLR